MTYNTPMTKEDELLELVIASLQTHLSESPRRHHFSPVPHIVCDDNTTMSVQASAIHHCIPRDVEGPWTHVEVLISDAPTKFGDGEEFSPSKPYGCVPIEDVAREYISRRKRLDVKI